MKNNIIIIIIIIIFFFYSHQSISDYSWEVYIVHSGVFAGWAYMHEDRTCVGIFNLHRGWLSLHRGPPVNVPIRRTAHFIMSFLQMTRREASSDQQIFLAAGGDRTRDL